MNRSWLWRASAAALAMGVGSAWADEAPTPVAPPPKVDSAPLTAPKPAAVPVVAAPTPIQRP